MEKIAFIIDSTVYLPAETIKEHDIDVISLNVIEGETTHKETDIDNDFIFERVNQKIRLTTSQPSPSEFSEVYEKRLKEGYTNILVLTLSKELSGTYQSALMARNMLSDPSKVTIFDTNNAAFGNELLAFQVAEMIRAKTPLKDIIKRTEKMIAQANLLFTVENLFFLQKGGRLSITQALIGTVLKVKPIIKIIDGKLKLYHKTRTYAKLYQFMIDEILNDPNYSEDKTMHVRLVERNAQDSLDQLESMMKERFPKAKLSVQHYIGPVFSVHIGPQGFGIAWTFE